MWLGHCEVFSESVAVEWVKHSDPRGMNQSLPKKLEKAAFWR